MDYTCYHCEHKSDSGHTITIYDQDGVEERVEILCDECYEEWLHSLKG